MDMNSKDDKEKIIKAGLEYLKNKENLELESFQLSDCRKIFKKMLDDMSVIPYFKFFPYEVITPEMMGYFCAEHLINRGVYY